MSLIVLGGAIVQGCTGGGNRSQESSTPSTAPPPEPRSPSGTDASQASASSAPTASSVANPNDAALQLRIHVDQLGYPVRAAKVAVIAADEAFPELELTVVEADENGRMVWEGKVAAATFDEASGDWVSQADFGALQTEGAYYLTAAGMKSHLFVIGNEVYEELFRDVARSYRLQRSGEGIDDPKLGLKLDPGHALDKEATLFFRDPGEKRATLDVSGGWYDAGDYGKYVPVAAVTVAQMLLAFELRPKAMTELRFLYNGERAHWPGADAAPDTLVEVKYELDWMLRMQRADGAVYHKVSGGVFPDFIVPAVDVQDRRVYGMSTYGTAMFAAAMAMGARVFQSYDPEYASGLLRSAKKAQAWLDAHPKAFFRLDEGQNTGSGPYDKETDREERYWALAELLKTTGDARYGAAIAGNYADLSTSNPGIVGWSNGQLLGQWALATAERSAPDVKAQAGQTIVTAAELILKRIREDGYRSALAGTEYTWASNKNALAKSELLLLANELAPNEAYVAGAVDQLHYVLGRNAMGMSYVTGRGAVYPVRPHHRISAASGILVPGLLVGGPNRYLNDPVLEKLADRRLPPAKSYVDDLSSYASNEYAIDYNAPLFFTLAILES
ncbi:glycoside hydrolase family 9 protein [Cohnella boryungensis]|uniref:Endoglucanase n=2 Tax=Cohnella boryungensis TaxID=768479 RepID=A0ABV8S5X0_9BACL